MAHDAIDRTPTGLPCQALSSLSSQPQLTVLCGGAGGASGERTVETEAENDVDCALEMWAIIQYAELFDFQSER